MTLSFSTGAVVVTSISGPNPVMQSLAQGARAVGGRFIMVGDGKTPKDFQLEGCDYYSLEHQRALPFELAKVCHERSYTRKNIGYLQAIAGGAKFIVETDDDNFPRDAFWADRNAQVTGDYVSAPGWLNAYHYFSDTWIYPRGFPIERCHDPVAAMPVRGEVRELTCPIQQGLADANPDVDAIYRMLFPLPLDFRQDPPLLLGSGTWCPFNSQNSTSGAAMSPSASPGPANGRSPFMPPPSTRSATSMTSSAISPTKCPATSTTPGSPWPSMRSS
jgi:hypothetical protein